MGIPATNCTVTAIATPGPSEDYETPEAADAQWTGAEPGYLVQESADDLQRGFGGGRRNDTDRTFIVTAAAFARTVDPGDTVTYTHEGSPHTRRVERVRVSAIAGTARLVLRDA